MKKKKLLVGAIATALVLSTGMMAYAAEPQTSEWFETQFKDEISMDGGDEILSFEAADLPEGVQYEDEIHRDNMEMSSQEGDNLIYFE